MWFERIETRLQTVLSTTRGGQSRQHTERIADLRQVGTADSGGEITNPVEYVVFDMSSSIRISDETKAKLEAVKRDDETFDELLDRLAITRTEEDVREMAGFAEEGIEEHMKQKREDLNDSFAARTTRSE